MCLCSNKADFSIDLQRQFSLTNRLAAWQFDSPVDKLVMGRDRGGHALMSYHQLVIDGLKIWWMLFPTPLEAETLIDVLMRRLQEKAADTIESLHKAGMKVWVLTGDKMETAAATCYASKLFRRSTQILELTKKRTEEQSLHDVLFELNRTVLRQRSISGYEIMHADIYCILGLQLILIYYY